MSSFFKPDSVAKMIAKTVAITPISPAKGLKKVTTIKSIATILLLEKKIIE